MLWKLYDLLMGTAKMKNGASQNFFEKPRFSSLWVGFIELY